jgi:hypothetical protein
VTCITALLTRILISGGVIFMYPLLYLIGRCQNYHANPNDPIARNRANQNYMNVIGNVFRVAYPWLGGQVTQLHERNRSVWPLVIAHTSRVIIYWSMYEACQIVWNYWFYAKSVPAGMLDWMPAIFLTIEYFSMFYVRSAMSMKHYPRLIFVYFMLYNTYFHVTLYGMYMLNMILFGLLSLQTSCWFLYRCEIPAFIKEEISEEVPRAHIVREASPTWSDSIPSEMSVFHPVTETARTRHFIGTELERRQRQEAQDGGGDGNGDNDIYGRGREQDTAAIHGLSALMQMAGVSFDPNTYTAVPMEDQVTLNGETKISDSRINTNGTELESRQRQEAQNGGSNGGGDTSIEIYGTSSDGDSSSSDDDFFPLSRP